MMADTGQCSNRKILAAAGDAVGRITFRWRR